MAYFPTEKAKKEVFLNMTSSWKVIIVIKFYVNRNKRFHRNISVNLINEIISFTIWKGNEKFQRKRLL